MTEKTLTDKAKRFIDEYLVDLNATQAAIRARYSKKTAYSIGCENLTKPNIQEEISRRQKMLQEKTGITTERVIAEYAKIAFYDPEKLKDEDFKEITPNQRIQNKFKALDSLARHLGMFDGKAGADEGYFSPWTISSGERLYDWNGSQVLIYEQV